MKNRWAATLVTALAMVFLLGAVPFVGAAGGNYAVAANQADKLGSEFRANSTSSDNQNTPSAVGIGGGAFVTVWTDDYRDGSSDKGIFAQIFNSAGEKTGSEFRCNSTTWHEQSHPAAAALQSGFVAAWLSEHQDYAGARAVVFQVFDSSGNKVGSETPVLRWEGMNHGYPAVTPLANDRFAVVWGAYDNNGPLVGKIFSSGGGAVTDHFNVASRDDYLPREPSLAPLSNGNWVAVWRYQGGDSDLYSIYGQILTSSGSKVGGEFQINSHEASSQVEPAAASLSDGGFAAVWASYGQDGSGYGVYGQRFDSNGNKLGDEFKVNSYTSGDQKTPKIIGLTNGGFVVTWQSYSQDSSGIYTVHGQLFDSSGNPDGDEFQLSSNSSYNQSNGAVASLPSDRFVALWSSYEQDGSGWGVYGQRFEVTAGGGGGGSGSLVEQFVTRFYQQCLLREPDSGGLAYWVAELESGRKSGADVARGFIHSTEFVNRNVNNTDYVTILYRAFFDREPDVAGYAYWVGRLDSGSTRDEVLDGFIYSVEFSNLCVRYGIRAY